MTQFVVIDVETGEKAEGPYATGAMADLRSRQLAASKQRKYRVVRIDDANVSTKPAWHDREQRLFDVMVYKRVPWHNEPWNTLPHFVHVSRKQPSKLAFTKNDEHGERDIQTLMRPGRYLSAYFADKLSQDDIRFWCGKYAAENEELELKFATTPDEIEEVYTNGPRSCMSHPANDYDSDEHPVRVYGAGDLAIAYIENTNCEREGDSEFGEDSRVTARAICWPAKKVYGRVYGDESRLCELLAYAGFRESNDRDFEGAGLLRIEDKDGRFVVPYLDHCCYVSDNGKFLNLGRDGDIECRTTNGLTENHPICDHCEERTDETYTVGDEQWCSYCRDEYAFYCDGCDETFPGSSHITTHTSRDLCEDCAQHYTECATCREWFAEGMREDINGDYHCEDCARNMAETHCGLLADDANDCDCRDCERWREEHADLFDEPKDDPIEPARERTELVVLKPTSPRVEDYRQLEMRVVFHFGQAPSPYLSI